MIDFFVGLAVVVVFVAGYFYFKKKGTLTAGEAEVKADAAKVEAEVKKVL